MIVTTKIPAFSYERGVAFVNRHRLLRVMRDSGGDNVTIYATCYDSHGTVVDDYWNSMTIATRDMREYWGSDAYLTRRIYFD